MTPDNTYPMHGLPESLSNRLVSTPEVMLSPVDLPAARTSQTGVRRAHNVVYIPRIFFVGNDLRKHGTVSAVCGINRRRSIMTRLVVSLATLVILSGCMSAAKHRKSVLDDSGERMTVGTVQKEIRVGMSGAEVAQVLGSPNIVSTDENRREVWIYDKISTESAYSTSDGGISTLILVSRITDVLLGGSGGMSASSGASSTSQRTLTVIIKFDDDKKVRDFAYHTSRF